MSDNTSFKLPLVKDYKFNYRQFFMIGLLIFITGADILMDYVNADSDTSIFKDSAYWIELSLSILSVVFVTLTARDFFREKELEQSIDINGIRIKIKAAHDELIKYNLMTQFENYVDEKNNERKLKAYTNYLRLKRFKAKKKKKDYWSDRINTAETDVTFLKTKNKKIKVGRFKAIKFFPIKTSTIFAAVDTNGDDDEDLSGNEAEQISQLLTKKVSLIIAISFAFSTLIFTGSNSGIGVIISTLMKLFRIISSAYAGASDGTTYIRNTLSTKMNRRLDFTQKFLENERSLLAKKEIQN